MGKWYHRAAPHGDINTVTLLLGTIGLPLLGGASPALAVVSGLAVVGWGAVWPGMVACTTPAAEMVTAEAFAGTEMRRPDRVV